MVELGGAKGTSRGCLDMKYKIKYGIKKPYVFNKYMVGTSMWDLYWMKIPVHFSDLLHPRTVWSHWREREGRYWSREASQVYQQTGLYQPECSSSISHRKFVSILLSLLKAYFWNSTRETMHMSLEQQSAEIVPYHIIGFWTLLFWIFVPFHIAYAGLEYILYIYILYLSQLNMATVICFNQRTNYNIFSCFHF